MTMSAVLFLTSIDVATSSSDLAWQAAAEGAPAGTAFLVSEQTAGLAAGSVAGATGVMIYMTGYVFMGAGTFAIILLMRRDGAEATKIVDLKGLSRTHPALAVGLLIMMFSMAGIPPLAGFFGKWYVFLAAVEAGLVPLAVIGVVTSVVGAFYYLCLLYTSPSPRDKRQSRMPSSA